MATGLIHISLQDLQGHSLLLYKMIFPLSGKAVALHLHSITAKAYLCDEGATGSLIHFRLACCILNLANKNGITLTPAYIPTHHNVEADYHVEGWFPTGAFFLTQLRLHFIFGVSQRWIPWHPHILINVRIITPWGVQYLWEFWG